MNITIQKGSLGNKKGWNFSVYYGENKYPNIISGLYKTKKEILDQVEIYKNTGKLDTYGTAE